MIHKGELMVMINIDRLNELREAERVLLELLEDIYKPECNMPDCQECGECSSNKSMKYPERDAGPKAYEDDIVAQDAHNRFIGRRLDEEWSRYRAKRYGVNKIYANPVASWFAGPESYTMI